MKKKDFEKAGEFFKEIGIEVGKAKFITAIERNYVAVHGVITVSLIIGNNVLRFDPKTKTLLFKRPKEEKKIFEKVDSFYAQFFNKPKSIVFRLVLNGESCVTYYECHSLINLKTGKPYKKK